MNRVILMGRIANEPAARTTPADKHVLNFTIAVQRRFAKEGQPSADFINCVAWNHTADFINKFFTKGAMIALEGQIQTRSWEGQDGKRQYTTEVLVESAFFTGEKRDTTPQAQTQTQGLNAEPPNQDGFFEINPEDEGDLPF